MNLDETVMMVRAICSSEKGPTQIRQLSNEFKSMTGSLIPFRQLGFNSLIEFLESQPDKFRLTTDKFTNEPAIQPVIDSELASLRSLVNGQKAKKKKAVKINRVGYPKYNQFQVNRQFYNPKPFYGQVKEKNFQPFHGFLNSNVNTIKTVRFDPNVKLNEFDTSEHEKISQDLIDNLTITNAAYFLNEHQIVVTHFVDCEHIYFRLVSENFSEIYDNMFKTMNEFYNNSRRIPVTLMEKDSICIAFDNLKYIRVQIKNIKLNQVTRFVKINKIKDQLKFKKAECFQLDEGKTKFYSITHLFKIDDQFLTVKFQAVKAKMEKFDNFHQNFYLQDHLNREICNKKFLAKKTQSKPLKLCLYDSENKCLNDQMLQNFSIFTKFRPIQDSFIETCIIYIDLENKLAYLEKPENQVFTLNSLELNNYFRDEKNKRMIKCLNHEAKLRINDENFNYDELFCAKYSIDSNWYRVKFIEEKKNTNDMLVLFVDFGNKDLVKAEEFCIMPEKFYFFKNLPDQSFPCSLIDVVSKYDFFKNLLFDNVKCRFKIIEINSSGLPTIQFSQALDVDMENSFTTIDNELIEKMNNINVNS